MAIEIDRALIREVLERIVSARPHPFEVQQAYPGRDDITGVIETCLGMAW